MCLYTGSLISSYVHATAAKFTALNIDICINKVIYFINRTLVHAWMCVVKIVLFSCAVVLILVVAFCHFYMISSTLRCGCTVILIYLTNHMEDAKTSHRRPSLLMG